MSEVRPRPTSLPAQLRAPGEERPTGQGAAALDRLAATRLQLVHPTPASQESLRLALRGVQYALVRGLRAAALTQHAASGQVASGTTTTAVCTVCFTLPDGREWAAQPAWVDIRVGAAGSKLVLEPGGARVCSPAVTLALLDGGALLLRSEAGDRHELRMWRLGAGTHTGLTSAELAALVQLPDGSTRSPGEVCADAP